MQHGTDNRQGGMRAVKRLVLIMAVVLSVSVVAFTIYMISASDDLATYVTAVYDTTYAAQVTVRHVEMSFLHARTQAEHFLNFPGPQSSGQLLARVQDLGGVPAALETAGVGEPERSRLTEITGQLTDTLRSLAGMDPETDMPQMKTFFRLQAEPLFEDVSRILQGVARIEDARLAAFLENAADVNRRINTLAAVFAVAVVAIVIAVCVGMISAIRKNSAGVYWRDTMFGLIADNVDEVFEVYDTKNDELLFVSSNLERVFGVPAEEYLAQNDRLRGHLLPEEEPLLKALYYDANLVGGPRHAEFHYDNPRTGTRQTFHSVLYPIQDARGEVTQHVLLTRDVTADSQMREELEAALAGAEAANNSKQDFLSRMSHEIRTPINAIIGMEALAMSSLNDPERVSYYLRQINVSARHLLGLVNDILDMSKIESGRLEITSAPINLDGMFSDIVMMVSSRTDLKQQTLTVKTPNCARRHVVGDELRLRQVLLNLLTNATKYTPEGGKIMLRATQEERPDGVVDMTFSVSDNGRGIPEEDRARIFHPFERGEHTSDQPGTGLGLPISRHLVKGMGGELTVGDNQGGGSVFSFTIPLAIDPADLPQVEGTQLPGKRLLVVEDNFINMEIARELLQNAGFDVCEAADGREAVDRFTAEPPGSFAAVLMDIQMPVMDGYEAAALMRADPERSDTPILAMTANVFQEEDRRWLFDDFIDKPIDPKRMLEQIKAARSAGRHDLPGDSDGQSDQTIPE